MKDNALLRVRLLVMEFCHLLCLLAPGQDSPPFLRINIVMIINSIMIIIIIIIVIIIQSLYHHNCLCRTGGLWRRGQSRLPCCRF